MRAIVGPVKERAVQIIGSVNLMQLPFLTLAIFLDSLLSFPLCQSKDL